MSSTSPVVKKLYFFFTASFIVIYRWKLETIYLYLIQNVGENTDSSMTQNIQYYSRFFSVVTNSINVNFGQIDRNQAHSTLKLHNYLHYGGEQK